MNPLAQAAALLAAAIHVLFFVLESILFTRPAVRGRFLVGSAADAELIRPMAFNQGFYNLFLALGAAAGVIAADTGHATVGRTLVGFACACMALAGAVLVATDRRFLRAALVQALPPLVALAALAL